MSHSRQLFSALLLLGVLAVSCKPKEDASAGAFGDAKPVTDDGRLRAPLADSGPPDFANAVSLSPSYDKASNRLTVVMKLKPGYHAYAPGETVGKPVELVVAADNGWSMNGVALMPPGMKKDLGSLGTSMILEGEVPLQAVVQGGSGELRGEVKAQVCTDKACDRPRSHSFVVPTT